MAGTKRIPRPYEKGYIRVSDGHRLYYERVGNKNGIPAVFLHGGPGTGFVESHKKLFNFKKFNVLFFDQRGAGRSKPFGSIKANTTWKLVEDINTLLDKFEINQAVFYGGSWGSTLGLVYAINNIDRVLGLVLRGIYLSNPSGMKHYLGGGVAQFAPEAWERFISHVPASARRNPLGYYCRKMASGNKKVRRKYAYEWSRYEISLVALKVEEADIEEMLEEYSFESLAILESHFIRKNCFIPSNYILNKAKILSKLPVSIVHGRYDLICRPIEAYQLHKKIENSRLNMVVAGHAASEPIVKKTLKKELDWVAGEVKRTGGIYF